MTPADEPTTPAGEPVTEAVSDGPAAPVPPVAEEIASTVNSNVDALAATVDAAAGAATTVREEAVQRLEDASASVASETAKAFQDVRERLRSIGVPGSEAGANPAGEFTAGAERFSKPAAAGYGRGAEAFSEFNAKALEAWRTNAEAALAHWQQLAGVSSWSEAIALNSAHARKQIEVMTAQTRELAELAGRMAREGAAKLTSRT